MKIIKINALDTLFFRDGKPFTMGEESEGSSLFPPAPSVFRGFLRTLFFGEKDGDLSEANTPGDPSMKLEIKHCSLYMERTNEALFPLPADLVIEKDDKINNTAYLKFSDNNLSASSYSYPYVLKTDENIKMKESAGKIWITNSQLEKYLDGKQVGSAIELDHIIIDEPKTGIGRDDATRATATGNFYQIKMNRPENEKGEKIGFMIGFDKLDLNIGNGLSRLGGEGKITKYKIEDAEITYSIPAVKGYTKMYLVTPAIFAQGWIPDALFRDYGLSVIAAAIRKHQSFGGWDIDKKEPKPMFRAVPAGSVYYIKQDDEGRLIDFINDFNGKPLSHKISIPDGYDREGFGIVRFGALQQQAISQLNKG